MADIELTDARVYYHLGEGLMQLGRRAEVSGELGTLRDQRST